MSQLLEVYFRSYLCGGGVEGEAEQRAQAQAGGHGQSHEQHPRQPHGPLGLGAVPPEHGDAGIGQLKGRDKTCLELLGATMG